MEILYENDDLIVAVKPAGVLSEMDGEKQSMPLLLLKDAKEKGKPDARFFGVHRLDREVGGVMVYAKNKQTAARLSLAIKERRILKEYLAVVKGAPEGSGTFEDLLFRDRETMKTYVVNRRRAGVRDAKLSYEKLGQTVHEGQTLSLVKVRLFTGRTHQIRVQFASRKMPLWGDGRYGSGGGKDRPALFSAHLALEGSFDCSAAPQSFPFTLFDFHDL